MSKYRGSTDVYIGGAIRQMKFDFNALCYLEELEGRPVQQVLDEANVGIRVLRNALCAGLSTYEKVTPHQIGLWMQVLLEESPGEFQKMSDSLREALEKAFAGLQAADTTEEAPEDPPVAEVPKQAKQASSANS